MTSYLDSSCKRELGIITLTIFACLNLLLTGSVYVSQLVFLEIAYSFNINILDSRFAFSSSCFLYAISLFIYGPLSDKLPAKRLILWGCIGSAICLIICASTFNYYVYLIFMSLIGCISASVPTALFAYVAKNTTNEKLTLIMGLMVSSSIIGIIFSRSCIAFITDYLFWQAAFYFYAILIMFITLLVLFVFRTMPHIVIDASTIGVKDKYPNLIKSLDSTINIILLLGFLLFFVYLGITTLLTFYLKGSLFNFSSKQLGWINLSGIGAIIGAILADRISKKMSHAKTIIIFLLGISVALIFIGYFDNLIVIICGIFILFLCLFGIQPVVITILNKRFSFAIRGTASALYLFTCFLGGSAGISILGFIWKYLTWQSLIDICLIIIFFNVCLIYTIRKKIT